MAWHAPVSVEVTAEPVSLSDLKAQCRVDFEDDDTLLAGLQEAARDHVERYCNVRFAEQDIVRQCDDWFDLMRLADGPIRSVSAISYIDPDGAEQQLGAEAFTVFADGIEPKIVPADGSYWPHRLAGSRITLSGAFGGDCPASVRAAILIKACQMFRDREDAAQSSWTVFDALLCNHRRGV
jgi:uncharacterized phiE125 gp8 family phage protein